MLKSELLTDQAVLVFAPDGPLAAADFMHIAAIVDPYIKQHGRVMGLMIHTRDFPGREDFAAFASHLRFVRDHHRQNERVAAVTGREPLNMSCVRAELVEARTQDGANSWVCMDRPLRLRSGQASTGPGRTVLVQDLLVSTATRDAATASGVR